MTNPVNATPMFYPVKNNLNICRMRKNGRLKKDTYKNGQKIAEKILIYAEKKIDEIHTN